MKSFKTYRHVAGTLCKDVSELLMNFVGSRLPLSVAHRMSGVCVAVLLLAAATSLQATEFYASPTGGGNGTIGSPWSLSTALSSSSVKAGDTVWLRGGRYTGYFTSKLSGTASAPIKVRQYPGERAILDANGDPHATFTANGSYVWYWGFEIGSSYSTRVSSQTGPWPTDVPNQSGVYAGQGTGNKFINLLIHDNPIGMALWAGATDIETYGCVVYYNGWNAPDRAHGHGVYMQNSTGGKQVNDCIIFDNADHGVQAYGSDNASVNNCTFTGNILFNNGDLFSSYGGGRNMLVGGDLTAQNPVVRNNMFFRSTSGGSGGSSDFYLGYVGTAENGIVENNFVACSSLFSKSVPGLVMQGNTFYGSFGGVSSSSYPNNTYSTSRPTSGSTTFLRVNQYDSDRANLAVYNWAQASSVSANVSGFLSSGDNYELHNAMNYFGDVITGTCNGSTITVPMTGHTSASPAGISTPTTSFPAFGAFVLVRLGASTGNTAPTISTVANQSISTGSSAGPLGVTISDAQTAAGSLTLSAASSNTSLLPNANIVLGGSGNSRTVTVTPAANQSGSATVTLTVSDGSLTASSTFTLTVTSANTAPTISAVGNQSVSVNSSVGPLTVTISDAQTAAGSLTLTASSSNTSLVPNGNIALGGSGSSRIVTVTPANSKSGTATITLTVSDGSATASTTFTITVTAANTAPTISTVGNQNINANTSVGPLSVTVGDVDTAAGSLTLTASSSNTTLVPNGNIVLGGSGANRTVKITPAANQSGSTTITLTVSDGTLTANMSFTVTVNAVNTAPTISTVANQTISANTSAGPLAVTVGDGQTSAGSLILTASSSNTALVPLSSVVLGGSGANRTVKVTPAANQSGSTTITLTVSDGALTANMSFTVTVTPVTSGNTAPSISSVGNQVISANGAAGPLTVTVSDAETSASSLTLTASSSNTSLVPNGNIGLGGSGSSRTVSATPAANQSGTAIITLTVSDGALSSSTSFIVTVNPVTSINTPPTMTAFADLTIFANTSTGPLSFTIADNDTPAGNLALARGSSEIALVPLSNIVFGGSGANRTVTITPLADQTGQSTITIFVGDGTNTTSRSFVLTVNPPPSGNTAPTISSIPNQTVAANNTAGPLTFTVNDAETAASSLTISASSSNPTLIPTGGIGLGKLNDSTRLLTVTPTAHQTGSATITVTVSDGVLNATTSFILTVTGSSSEDNPPAISSIDSQTIATNSVAGPLSFTVDDTATSPDNVTVTASSSNSGLVPTSAIALGGSGRNRTVTVTPTKYRAGVATITVNASAGSLSSSTSFRVTVLNVTTNTPPAISPIPDQMVKVNRSGRIKFTVSDDAKRPSLILAHLSSNPSLIPEANIQIRGGKSNRTVRFKPAKDQTGTATITLSAGDGQFTTFTTFSVTIAADVPKQDEMAKHEAQTGSSSLPALATIPDQILEANSSTAPLPLTVTGTTAPSSALRFTATSSNTNLLPVGSIKFDGSPSMTITPATNQFGIAAITVTVSDGTEEDSTSFAIAVNPLVSTNQMVYVPSTATLKPSAFDVDVPATGTYIVWCHVLAKGSASGALQMRVDNEPADASNVAPYVPSSDWQWTAVAVGTQTFTPRTVALTSGLHTLSFQTADPNVTIDRVLVTNDRQTLLAQLAP